ncbi:MAG: CHASE2 domain-containing protein [Proteobacteria bacterium]|nr:CHASE2 domain-containing protein [Pseudomonadota bacterium]MBU4298142.1 CHASE2 domain-containing protein [Pseudomonadota bacterium]MCG2749518.1 CHASE2 domain-containing protein [Desulfobulbaceae bacterium]
MKRFLSLLRRITGAVERPAPKAGSLFKLFREGSRLRRLWSTLQGRLPKRLIWRRLVIHLGLTLLVVAVMYAVREAPFRILGEDHAMDLVIRMCAGAKPTEPVIPLGWIDIDDDAYREWDEPSYLPRKELADLMRLALEAKPRMLIVDVDLARRNHEREVDAPVIKFLEEYADKCRALESMQGKACPPVVLAASLRTREPGCVEQRISWLDKVVKDSPHLFYWAAPLFEQEKDGVVRRWRIWTVVKRDCDNSRVALPSFQLLAAVGTTCGRNRTRELEKLQQCLEARAGGNKESESKCEVILWPDDKERKKILTLSEDRIERRILYAIPDPDRGMIPVKTLNDDDTKKGDKERPLLLRIPAGVASGQNAESIAATLGGRVVFIGGSFLEGHDIYNTPLNNTMPGVLIITNALYSLLEHGEAQAALSWQQLLLIMAFITVMSISITTLGLGWGLVVSFAVLYFLFLPVSVFSLMHGRWLDFALPIAVVGSYGYVIKFLQWYSKRKRKQRL